MGRSHTVYGGGGNMSRGWSCLFYFLVFLTEILLFGVLILSLLWVYNFRNGFAWNEDVEKQFNLHPVLMITGFIFLMGNAMLVYRLFRCCDKTSSKMIHTMLYLMAIPAIVISMIAVFDSRNLSNPPKVNLYSLHSWVGLATIGLFALQFVFGFFSFWLLTCCDSATARFRANLVPIHSAFGIITFMLAIAACLTGYTEKAFFALSNGQYSSFVDETWYINAQGAALVGLAILMGFILISTSFSRRTSPVAFVEPPSSNNHYVMTQKSYYYREHDP